MKKIMSENVIFQVNVSYRLLADEYQAWLSTWYPDGYVGRLTETTYEDGSDETDWAVFVGTESECQAFLKGFNYKP